MTGDGGSAAGTSGMLLEAVLTTDALLEATGDAVWLQALLDVEAALAGAQADVGLMPAAIAEAVTGACRAERFDAAALGRAARLGGNPVIPLVAALRAAVPGEAADRVHWGATSQDILDTAAMLVTRRALELIDRDLVRLADGAATLAEAHRDTLMAGRTLLQQALPMPFGLKAAGWLAGVLDTRRALAALGPRLAVQLGGATGTLAALGGDGPAVTAALALRLGLAAPLMPWHTARQRVAEIAGVLGTVAGTAAKVALDVALLMQTEVAEVAEPAAEGRGGSSTMPHKRNPVLATEVLAATRRAHGLVPVLLGAMVAEHERAVGAWHSEWGTLVELLRLAGGAAAGTADIVGGLEVHAPRMAANLEGTQVLLAERVALALAPALGRADAARLVGDAARRATGSDRSFAGELLADPVLATHLDPAELRALLDPAGYLGSSSTFIDAALEEHRRARKDR